MKKLYKPLIPCIALLLALALVGCDLFYDDYDDYERELYVQEREASSEDFSSIAEVESHYDIKIDIQDPVWSESQIVEIFNQQTETLGPDLLKYLVAFYRYEGIPTVFVFETPNETDDASVEIHESVEFIIHNVEGAHASLIHETGHLLHFYLMDTDQDPLNEFILLNDGISYIGDKWEDLDELPEGLDRVFVTTYAASEAEEDFAEAFGFAFRYPDHLYDGDVYEENVIAASYDETSGIARKVALIRSIVASLSYE